MNNTVFNYIHDSNLPGLFQLLNKNKALIEITDEMGRTPLMEAIIVNHTEITKLIIANGADVNKKDNKGWTALHFAAQLYSYDLTKLLLENGADVDSQDNYGNSPLSTAVFNSRGRGEVILLLIKFGADKNLKNKNDVSPYELAKKIANYNIFKFVK
jgi:hypothetical protein